MKTQATIIFDNGGGITVQLRAWQADQVHYSFGHYYDDPEAAASGVYDALHSDPSCIQTWEGNESAACDLQPTQEEQDNGGYRVGTYWSWADVVEDTDDADAWANVRAWDAAVRKLADENATEEYIITDGAAIERASTLEEAASIAEDWYDYLIEAGTIADACSPDLDASSVESLNDSIGKWQQRIAEAAGEKDFSGHGNYYVTAADRMGLNLTVTAEKVYS